MGASKRVSPRGDGMTPLEQWRQMAMAENKRAQRNWLGLENDQPVKVKPRKPEPKPKPEETNSAKALKIRIQRLHLDGQDPESIAASFKVSEAVVWKSLRKIYQQGRNIPDAFRQMRKARIKALKQQGLPPQEIADIMGMSTVTVNIDIREMREEQARAAALRSDTGRMPHG